MPSFDDDAFAFDGDAAPVGDFVPPDNFVELVARDSGPIVVYADDEIISTHTTQRKAAQSAANKAFELLFTTPDVNVRYEQHVVVDVTINAVDLVARVQAGGDLTPLVVNNVTTAGTASFGLTGGETVTTTVDPDIIPNQFTFIDQSNVAVGSFRESEAIIVDGIDSPSPITVAAGSRSQGYRINSGTITSSPGTVNNGDLVYASHIASVANDDDVDTTITIGGIGGVSDTFTSTTVVSTGDTVTVSNLSELQSAVSGLVSGQTIIMNAGTYSQSPGNSLFLPQGLSNVTIKGATGNPDDVILDGGQFGFWAQNCPNLVIQYMTFRDQTEHGLIIQGDSENMLLENLIFQDSTGNTIDQFVKLNSVPFRKSPDNGICRNCYFEFLAVSGNGYYNAFDAHYSDGWTIEDCTFKNIRSTSIVYPAILMWRASRNTIVQNTTFIDCGTEISFGRETTKPAEESDLSDPALPDHSGGSILNNVITRQTGLSGLKDVGIAIWDSPNTICSDNTITINGTYPNAIECRFPRTTGCTGSGNTVDAAIVLDRSGASNNSITAGAPVEAPDPFQSLIVNQFDVVLGDTITSEPFSPTGTATAAVMSVNIGSWQLNGTGGFVTSGTWSTGDSIELRHTASEINNTPILQTLNIAGVLGTFTSRTVALPGGGPLSLPLASVGSLNSRFSYLGTFNPHPNGSDAFDWTSGGVYADSTAGVFYGGRSEGFNSNRMSAVTLENPGSRSSLVKGLTTMSGDIAPGAGNEKLVVGNMVHYSAAYPNGRLFTARIAQYDPGFQQNSWGQASDPNITNQGGLCQWNGTKYGLSNERIMCGPMGVVPDIWQSTLGGDCYMSQSRPSIVSNSCTGFAFGVFNGDDVPQGGGSTNIVDWMWFQFGDGIFGESSSDPADDYFSYTNTAQGCAFIVPGTRTLAYLGANGYGKSSNPPGCFDGSSTAHYPYRYQISYFDLADIVNGTSRNSPYPYGFELFGNAPYGFYGDCPGQEGGNCINGHMNFDYQTNRLYSLHNGTGSNRNVDVWSFT